MREKDVRFQVSSARSAAKDSARDFDGRQADAADGDAVALLEFLVQLRRSDPNAAISVLLRDAGDAPDFLDDACEHELIL